MEKYQVSDSPNGPWLEIAEHKTAKGALESARAAFPTWNIVYIAKMRPMIGADILTPPGVMFSDITEAVQIKFGSTANDLIQPLLGKEMWDKMAAVFDEALAGYLDEYGDPQLVVPEKVNMYPRNHHVRPGDFDEEEEGGIDLDSLLDD